jgi:tyrosinase
MLIEGRNVDRLFAIWQAINPRAYDINKEEIDGTFSITAGTIVDQNTPLPPFNDATGRTPWTSATARRTEAFNYVYPETQRWRFRSDAEYINNVQQTVFQLYGGVSRIFRRGGGFNARAANDENAPLAAFALSDSVPPVVETVPSAQKPLSDPQSGSKPAAISSRQAPAKEHKTGFLSNIGHKIKDVIGGDDDKTPKDGTRGGLDLEAEIGKRKYFNAT